MFSKVRGDYTNRMKYTVDSFMFRKVRGDYTNRTKCTVDFILFRKVRGDYTNLTKYTVGPIMFRKVRGDYANRMKYTVDSFVFRKVRGDYTNCKNYTVCRISSKDIELIPLLSHVNHVWGPRHLPSQCVKVTSVLSEGTMNRAWSLQSPSSNVNFNL
jgi:hypothetical protein